MNPKDFIETWLPLAVLAVGIIAAWTRAETNAKNMAEKQKEIETRVDEIERNTDTFREVIKVDIAEIKTTMRFILEAIVELKKK